MSFSFYKIFFILFLYIPISRTLGTDSLWGCTSPVYPYIKYNNKGCAVCRGLCKSPRGLELHTPIDPMYIYKSMCVSVGKFIK